MNFLNRCPLMVPPLLIIFLVGVAVAEEQPPSSISCEGTYKHHLQGICVHDQNIYWSFTTTLVKTDRTGHVLQQIPVANHHGDLCCHNSRVYVAVNLGKFNDAEGHADSWVYVYDAETLKELARHEVQEVFHGAGGLGVRDNHFFVVGGLPAGVTENYAYEYDENFRFQKKHIINSGHTLMGIQTATFAHGRWWFGCYGNPKVLLVTDSEFQLQGRFEFDCSLGIDAATNGQLFAASGRCDKTSGCTGSIRLAIPDPQSGLRYLKAVSQ